MDIRFSRGATGALVVAAFVLTAGTSWAIYNQLAPSKDEWKLKYEVEVSAAGRDTLNVRFTLADEGRLKPIYSITLVAFSKQTDSQGGRSYDVKEPFKLESSAGGKRAGQVHVRREFADRALIRILTQTVDGQRQQYAAYYDIPLRKFLNQGSAAASRHAPRSGPNFPQ